MDMTIDAVLGRAYHRICLQRKDRGHNNSVWDLRLNWTELKLVLQLINSTNTMATRLDDLVVQLRENNDAKANDYNGRTLAG